jgi:tRNA pseudouridine32 synthase/23S rRNA pseudouridine746 synthase
MRDRALTTASRLLLPVGEFFGIGRSLAGNRWASAADEIARRGKDTGSGPSRLTAPTSASIGGRAVDRAGAIVAHARSRTHGRRCPRRRTVATSTRQQRRWRRDSLLQSPVASHDRAVIRYFDSPPALPARFASPFGEPPAIARCAADELVASLGSMGEGKMFGVLVVADRAGRIGYLRAFSGMLGGRWDVPGFVPPVFDVAARDSFWPAGEAELEMIEVRHLGATARVAELRDELAAIDAAQADAARELRDRHRANKEVRHVRRAVETTPEGRHALDQLSRADTAESRRMTAAHTRAREPLATRAGAAAAELAAIDHLRAERSRFYLHAIHDTYVFANARGERRGLRELFAPAEPPGGAGDCAAPKLFAYAYARGLRPIALGEVWWGPAPVAGGRHAGVYYPACRGKCGPILGHVLGGLDIEPAPIHASDPAAQIAIVHDDPWLAIVDKPCGVLSVPGRGGLADSVAARMAARWPGATVVHRLDLDASGLLIIAKTPETHAALQRAFAMREVDKRYVAWLEGTVERDGGVVELPLRTDVDDRPRQIHDPVHGKDAVTEWRVLAREREHTVVELVPRTGRSHQLRVHAAHPCGIGAAIVGDRLYGARAAVRLMLHARALAFDHPQTRRRIELEAALPSSFAIASR